MNLRWIKRLLWGGAGLALASTFATVVWAVVTPVEVREPEPMAIATPELDEAVAQLLPPLSEFEPVMQMKLQQPLVDPPVVVAAPVAPPPPPPPPPPLQVELLGTILEPGRSVAILKTHEGKTELKGVGETSYGAEVLRIERRRVTMLHHGEQLVLKVPVVHTDGSLSDAD